MSGLPALTAKLRRLAEEGPRLGGEMAAAKLREHFSSSVHVRSGATASETTITGDEGGVTISGPRSLRYRPSKDAIRLPEGELAAAGAKAIGQILGGG
ncbi:MAG TPA: hypothetical protein VGQ38_15330 [Gaiellaceae bacterium]|nr:hypothetical protein [Gaiellaceae bacterium]